MNTLKQNDQITYLSLWDPKGYTHPIRVRVIHIEEKINGQWCEIPKILKNKLSSNIQLTLSNGEEVIYNEKRFK